MVSASQDGSMSAVALGVVTARCASWLASQFHRRWCAAAPAKLHKKALHKVVSSQSRSSFCGVHRWRALRVYAALFMQNCLRRSGLVSRLHSQAAARLTCRRLPPSCCAGDRALVRRCAQCSIWRLRRASRVCPSHPGATPSFARHWPGAVCPSAPKGLPAVPRWSESPVHRSSKPNGTPHGGRAKSRLF